jgi:uncharacterized protein YwgA
MNYPKNIQLSQPTDHGQHGQMIKFYCAGDGKYHTEKKAKDHELFMRKADAALLHHMSGDVYAQLKKLVDKQQIKGDDVQQALKMMWACWEAFGPNTTKYDFFLAGPYSNEILSTAAEYMLLALDELNPARERYSTRQLQAEFTQLTKLLHNAQSRYSIEKYND